jgi:hypothetical protein
MVACTKKSQCPDSAHDFFLAVVMPAVVRHARVVFRGLGAEAKQEAIAACVACSWVAYCRLIELNKRDIIYPPVLARLSARQVKRGRRVGSKMCVNDVASELCRREKGVVVERLDRFDSRNNEWREAVVVDTKSAPVPDTVAFRIDFADFLKRLSKRDRRICRFLALNHRTLDCARKFSISPGRVAQLRREFASSWAAFRGEGGATARLDPVAA